MSNVKKFLLFLLFVFAVAIVKAQDPGAERFSDVTPASTNNGNNWRGIAVAFSTSIPVIISSAPANAGLAIKSWRLRIIVNSSDGLLQLLPSGTTSQIFCSTCSIVLSSGSSTAGVGGSYTTYNQGTYWGLWSSTTFKGGAAGEEEWYGTNPN